MRQKNSPKVSIVLPSYNGARFLNKSVESIINQSFTDWELVIVDDCSTDNTLKIAKSFAKRDPRISVIHNEPNKKLPASLNVGFDAARGEYLTWTSDDNIAKKNWLSTLVDYMDKNPDVDMVAATMDYIDEDGKFLFKTLPQKSPIALGYKCNVGAAFMYRRKIADVVGKYDEDAFCAEDYDYWCRVALAGRLDYIPDNIYEYRTNSQSLTALQQPRIRQKTAIVQNKYRDDIIKKFHLNYWNRAKLEYLGFERKWRPGFIMFDMYKFLLKNTTNLLLFWNKKLKQKTYEKFEIKM